MRQREIGSGSGAGLAGAAVVVAAGLVTGGVSWRDKAVMELAGGLDPSICKFLGGAQAVTRWVINKIWAINRLQGKCRIENIA